MRRTFTSIGAAAFLAACAAPAAGASSAAMASSVPASAVPARPAGSGWGTAEVLPGTVALNTDGHAYVASMSCPSAGNCGAGGSYRTIVRNEYSARPFVDGERDGRWQVAKELPGMAGLHAIGSAYVTSLSCASPGNCGAVGDYSPTAGDSYQEAFVASETDGSWGKAQEVTGLPDGSGAAVLNSTSCAAAGDCSAGGAAYRTYGGRPVRAIVVGVSGGTWGAAEEVPGIAALDVGEASEVTSVSCASPGNCSAGGYYTGKENASQAFVVSETGGTWGQATEVPGTAALNTNGSAQVTSVSCASPGNCSAGGYYNEGGSSFDEQAFVVSETGGTWGRAIQVPGTAALNTGGSAQDTSVSCASAGDCAAGGYYYDNAAELYLPFVVNQVHGTWGRAEEVPGMTAIDASGSADISSVSCGAAGDCSAGGYYNPDNTANTRAFVVTETRDTWGDAQNVAGTTDPSVINSVSCGSAASCVAGGETADASSAQQAFIVART